MRTKNVVIVIAAALTACGPTKSGGLDSGASSETASEDSGANSSESSEESGQWGSNEDAEDTGTEYPAGADCDVLEQDCPVGYKCIPRPSDSSQHGCSPVLGDVEAPDICKQKTEGDIFLDDCDADSFCSFWHCHPLCSGTNPEDATCPAGYRCTEGALVCDGAYCDPLNNDCPFNWECGYLYATCQPGMDASFATAAVGDECDQIEVDYPEVACAQSACALGLALQDCPFSFCCTPWCDPADPQACAGQADSKCSPVESGGYTYGFCSAP